MYPQLRSADGQEASPTVSANTTAVRGTHRAQEPGSGLAAEAGPALAAGTASGGVRPGGRPDGLTTLQ
jgi:hypothetical protein